MRKPKPGTIPADAVTHEQATALTSVPEGAIMTPEEFFAVDPGDANQEQELAAVVELINEDEEGTEAPENAPEGREEAETVSETASIDPTPEISPIKGEKFGTRRITVPASDHDLGQLSKQQRDTLRELRRLESAKKEAASDYAARIKTQEEKLDRLAVLVDKSQREIEVPIRSFYDLQHSMWMVFRTGVEPQELLESRIMTPDEVCALSQIEMFEEGATLGGGDEPEDDEDRDDSDPFAEDAPKPDELFPMEGTGVEMWCNGCGKDPRKHPNFVQDQDE